MYTGVFWVRWTPGITCGGPRSPPADRRAPTRRAVRPGPRPRPPGVAAPPGATGVLGGLGAADGQGPGGRGRQAFLSWVEGGGGLGWTAPTRAGAPDADGPHQAMSRHRPGQAAPCDDGPSVTPADTRRLVQPSVLVACPAGSRWWRSTRSPPAREVAGHRGELVGAAARSDAAPRPGADGALRRIARWSGRELTAWPPAAGPPHGGPVHQGTCAESAGQPPPVCGFPRPGGMEGAPPPGGVGALPAHDGARCRGRSFRGTGLSLAHWTKV